MNKNQKMGVSKNVPYKKGRPIPGLSDVIHKEKQPGMVDLLPLQEETKTDLVEDTADVKTDLAEEAPDISERYAANEAFKNQVERFIEISKYFSSPLRKTASYLSDRHLVSYPSTFRIEYKRGNVITEHIKFCNLTLEPVFVKLFKLTPELEQIKFINLTLSRCKRIPPGLSFNLGFVYDDANEKPACNSKMIFVASRKTTTPCYQVCEIELLIDALKIRRVVQERKWM